MDGVVLTIQFRDESAVGPPGTGIVSQQASGPQSNLAADTQAQITAAGGVSQLAAKNNSSTATTTYQVPQAPSISPPVAAPLIVPSSSASTDPLFKTVSSLVQADPNVTAAEIAKALGIQLQQATELFQAATLPRGTTSSSVPSSPTMEVPSTPDLIFPKDWRRTQEDKWIQSEAERFNSEYAAQKQQEQQQAQQAADRARVPPPPPMVEPPIFRPYQARQDESEGPSRADIVGVQNTIGQITSLALAGGPVGNATARTISAVTGIPAVSEALASAAPALAGAAPYVGAGIAALGIPAAQLYMVEGALQAARANVTGLSPEVAGADARASIRQLVADLNTSRVLGNEIADSIDARSRISTAFQGIMDQYLEKPLQTINAAQTVGARLVEELRDSGLFGLPTNVGTSIGTAIGEAIKAALPEGLQKDLADTIKDLKEYLKGKDIGINNPLNFFHEMPFPELPPPFTNKDGTLNSRDFVADMKPGLG